MSHRRTFGRRIKAWLINFTAPLWSDRAYLTVKFWIHNGYWPDLKNPKSYNEKVNWLKLNLKNPDLSRLVDKAEVKHYIANKIGEKYIIPTLAIYDSVDEINFDELPEQFVLKCTHDSGGIVVCKDKSRLDKQKSLSILNKALKRKFISLTREYPYATVRPRIIAEKYMEDEFGELRDYKFFCSKGKPWMVFIATGRQKGIATFDFFDMQFNHLPIINGHPMSKVPIEKPICFDRMVELASTLSEEFIHVRVDFYEVKGEIYFGELTFFHNSGIEPIEPREWDFKMGEFIHLPLES